MKKIIFFSLIINIILMWIILNYGSQDITGKKIENNSIVWSAIKKELNQIKAKQYTINDCRFIFDWSNIKNKALLKDINLYANVEHWVSFFNKNNILKDITIKYLSGKIDKSYLENAFQNIQDNKSLWYSILSDFLKNTSLCSKSKDPEQCTLQLRYIRTLFNNKKIDISKIHLTDFRLYYLYWVKNSVDYRKLFFKNVIWECEKILK